MFRTQRARSTRKRDRHHALRCRACCNAAVEMGRKRGCYGPRLGQAEAKCSGQPIQTRDADTRCNAALFVRAESRHCTSLRCEAYPNRRSTSGDAQSQSNPVSKAPLPTIGFLSVRSPDDAVTDERRSAWGCCRLYAKGRNVRIEYRWGNGDYDRLPALAQDLIRSQVGILAAFGPALAAKGFDRGWRSRKLRCKHLRWVSSGGCLRRKDPCWRKAF